MTNARTTRTPTCIIHIVYLNMGEYNCIKFSRFRYPTWYYVGDICRFVYNFKNRIGAEKFVYSHNTERLYSERNSLAYFFQSCVAIWNVWCAVIKICPTHKRNKKMKKTIFFVLRITPEVRRIKVDLNKKCNLKKRFEMKITIGIKKWFEYTFLFFSSRIKNEVLYATISKGFRVYKQITENCYPMLLFKFSQWAIFNSDQY